MWDLLFQLDAYKSMERDGIRARVLKELADVIVRCLSIIFQQSLESGEVSINWKLSNVVLVFKLGKKEDFGNNSPVSVTLVPGKIRENIVLKSLLTEKHLKVQSLIIACPGS